jgi:hypothetical protein
MRELQLPIAWLHFLFRLIHSPFAGQCAIENMVRPHSFFYQTRRRHPLISSRSSSLARELFARFETGHFRSIISESASSPCSPLLAAFRLDDDHGASAAIGAHDRPGRSKTLEAILQSVVTTGSRHGCTDDRPIGPDHRYEYRDYPVL